MKRLSALLLFFVALIAAAPAVSAQFRYAPIVGVTYTDLKFKQDIFPVSSLVGGQAGIQAELMFPGIGFGMDFGLIYNMIGAKCDIGTREIWSSEGYRNSDVRLHTLDIPFHLRFKWTRMNGFEDYLAPFVYGGPDFTLSVGHSKIKGNPGAPRVFNYPTGELGLSCGGGFEVLRRWQVSVQYTWGMTYIIKTSQLENISARNRQWAVRVAYMF